MSEIRLRWFVRCFVVRFVAWAIRLGPAAELRDAFDRSFKHRDEEWRRHVWSLAAERAERRSRETNVV